MSNRRKAANEPLEVGTLYGMRWPNSQELSVLPLWYLLFFMELWRTLLRSASVVTPAPGRVGAYRCGHSGGEGLPDREERLYLDADDYESGQTVRRVQVLSGVK
jgi:hypothetical protein